MSASFEELDYRVTPMGAISLRRRRMLSLDRDVFEVKLGDEFLMSSLFTVGEEALARLGLKQVAGDDLEVVVGGLGLGHTAAAVLEDQRVRSLLIVEAIEAVVEWHRRGLVPMGEQLTADSRCGFAIADFFAAAEGSAGFDPARPGRRWDAVLLDIDHSPSALLHSAHQGFYTRDGLRRLARWLKPNGVFAMWSDGAPEAAFTSALAHVFAWTDAKTVNFDNPLQGRTASCTIYLARRS